MQGYNCIIVYNQEKNRLLFCKRRKNPYKGLYNLVGGKIEEGEDGFTAAYRELEEETGIRKDDIQLYHLMDFTYYQHNCKVEVYTGVLNCEITLREEANPLVWLEESENFFDLSRFAGEGNIGHMIEQVRVYGLGLNNPSKSYIHKVQLDKDSVCIGVDGCKGGWIGAIISHGLLMVDKYPTIEKIVDNYLKFDEFLVDMIIGLPSNREQISPDNFARKLIRERSSTIFPRPCRQAIYAESIAQAYLENEQVLGKKFTPLTVGIIPKIRELDTFLQNHPKYKNVLKESHPEVCFAMLRGSTVLSKKSEQEGLEDRIGILSQYLPELDLHNIKVLAKELKCMEDDIIDAICLAVTANLANQGYYQIVPDQPMTDDTGLILKLMIPKLN